MPVPNITPLPTPPVRSDAPVDFSAKADAFVAALPPLASEINVAIEFIDEQSVAAEQSAVDAEQSRQQAEQIAGQVEQQVEAAEDAAAAAAESELHAQAAAAAAGAAIGLPALAGHARQPLRVLPNEQGVEFAATLALVSCMEMTSVTAAASGAVNLDLSAASLFVLTLAGNVTLSVSNPPEFNSETASIIVRVTQGATAQTLTWFPGITWLTPGAAAPAAPGPNKTVEFILSTMDGASWIGRRGSAN